MQQHKRQPIALTIAGSDSGGGAGIQADLKTFAALGVHGTSAITCLTAQNPRGVLGIQACAPALLRRQIEAVFAELSPAACKTGMLLSRDLIRVVADCLTSRRRLPLVVDPVMVATSGARLLKPSALRAMCDGLLPLATITTPNKDEAEWLLGNPIHDEEDLREAARALHRRFGCAALVKGGHLRGRSEAVDILFDGRDEWLLCAPFVRGISTHGTGCTYSAALAGHLALGQPLAQAVARAKEFITQAIASSRRVAGHWTLNWSWR
jgi:hydroxymethylpyrimidine/phosphomethylpyrimidine kinase